MKIEKFDRENYTTQLREFLLRNPSCDERLYLRLRLKDAQEIEHKLFDEIDYYDEIKTDEDTAKEKLRRYILEDIEFIKDKIFDL